MRKLVLIWSHILFSSNRKKLHTVSIENKWVCPFIVSVGEDYINGWCWLISLVPFWFVLQQHLIYLCIDFFCYFFECLHKENKNNINTQSPDTMQLKRCMLVFKSKLEYKLDSHMNAFEFSWQNFFIVVHCLLMFCMFFTLVLSNYL